MIPMADLHNLPKSPDEWVLQQIANTFNSYKDAVEYFTYPCNCMPNFVCVAEEIGRFITDAVGVGLNPGKEHLQSMFKILGKN